MVSVSFELYCVLMVVGVWTESSVGDVIRFEKVHARMPYGGNYNNLRCIVVHFGAPVKSWGGFSRVRPQLASEENAV